MHGRPGHSLYYEPSPAERTSGYDNVPVGEYGTHPQRSLYHWQVPIEQVDQERRDERVLDSSVEYFLEACGQHPPLSEREEAELFKSYNETQDPQVRERLILHNLRFVVHIAKRERRILDLPAESMEDLLHNGLFGLMRAVDKYDPKRGKFTTYAGPWIKQSIRREFLETGRTVDLPLRVGEKILELGRATHFLWLELGRRPTDDELSEWLYMEPEEVHQLRLDAKKPASLDAFVGKDEDGEWQTRHSLIYDSEEPVLDSVNRSEQDEQLDQLLDACGVPDHWRTLLKFRWCLGEDAPLATPTYGEIGQVFGLTPERARQIEANMFKRLAELAKTPLMRNALREGTISTETERFSTMRKRQTQEFSSYADYMAWQIRYRRRLDAQGVEQAVQREAAARKRARQEALDAAYESLTIERAIGEATQAGGRLMSRREYFTAQRERNLSSIETAPDKQGWEVDFAQAYGKYTSAVMNLLYGDLQTLTKGGNVVSLTQLENHISEYDGRLFGVRPEFLAAVLEAGERHGLIYCERTPGQVRYRLRRPDEPMPEPEAPMPRVPVSALPDYARHLLKVVSLLGAGHAQDTAITFSHLRRYWSENVDDLDETRLRRGLAYLQKAGLVSSATHRIRGNDIWLNAKKQGEWIKTVRLKPSELWFEDYK